METACLVDGHCTAHVRRVQVQAASSASMGSLLLRSVGAASLWLNPIECLGTCETILRNKR